MVLAVVTTLDAPGLARPVKLREERDNEDVPLRTGCRVWSCARLLAAWLARASAGRVGGGDRVPRASPSAFPSPPFPPAAPSAPPVCIAGKDVLELGAGTGAVGLACAALGARSVTMTDRDEATLALMHANARLNGHYDPDASCDVTARPLDWDDVSTYVPGGVASPLPRGFDVVVAADVLYLPEHCASLPRAAAAHLAPGGTAVLAVGLRRAGLLEALIAELVRLGLAPVAIDRESLKLPNLPKLPSEHYAAEIRRTAAEHAHDGEQIAAAGGYVLIACVANDDAPSGARWDERRAVIVSEGRKTEEDAEETHRVFEEGRGPVGEGQSRGRDRGPPPPPSGPSSSLSPRPASATSSLSSMASDAASALGDFLDDLAALEVETDAPACDGDDGSGSPPRKNKNKPPPRLAADSDSDDASAPDPPFPAWRVKASRAETTRGAPSERTIEAAARSLASNGFVAIVGTGADGASDTGLVAAETLDAARDATANRLASLLDAVGARLMNEERGDEAFFSVGGEERGVGRVEGGRRYAEDAYFRFAEVCSRERGGRRFDVTAERRRSPKDEKTDDDASDAARGDDSDSDAAAMIRLPPAGPPEAIAIADEAASAWDRVRRAIDPWTAPVASEAFGILGGGSERIPVDEKNAASRKAATRVTATGAVVALPGAPPQRFHADGYTRGVVNVFAPLVDLTPELGPTRFKRGSHLWAHDAAHVPRAEEARRNSAEEVAPAVPRGALVAYDYRCWHAGGANVSDPPRARPIAYVVRSAAGAEDTWNFPDESVWGETARNGR